MSQQVYSHFECMFIVFIQFIGFCNYDFTISFQFSFLRAFLLLFTFKSYFHNFFWFGFYQDFGIASNFVTSYLEIKTK